jgi:hypothetical protein
MVEKSRFFTQKGIDLDLNMSSNFCAAGDLLVGKRRPHAVFELG